MKLNKSEQKLLDKAIKQACPHWNRVSVSPYIADLRPAVRDGLQMIHVHQIVDAVEIMMAKRQERALRREKRAFLGMIAGAPGVTIAGRKKKKPAVTRRQWNAAFKAVGAKKRAKTT